VPQPTVLLRAPCLCWYKSNITHWVGGCGWGGGACVRYVVERDHLGNSTVDGRGMLK
jgi:hypothetical protein